MQNTQKFFQNNVSFTLILINIVMALLQVVIPGFTKFFVLDSSLVLLKPWTLITTMFLHGSFSHLLFNMYALLIFGPLVERKVGKTRFLLLYFLAGLVASLAALYYPSALGASGAIMGVIGMVIMFFPKMKVLFFFIVPMSMRTAGIIFAAIDLFGLFTNSGGVAHLAHLAGLAAGLLYGYYLLRQRKTFTMRFTAKSASQPPHHSSSAGARKTSSGQRPSYEKTIELTKDDLDNYYKYGKL